MIFGINTIMRYELLFKNTLQCILKIKFEKYADDSQK